MNINKVYRTFKWYLITLVLVFLFFLGHRILCDRLLSGHKVVPLSEEEQRHQRMNFEGHSNGLVKLYPGNWFLLESFVPFLDKYYTFQFKPTDVVIMTVPKSGTTWMQEIIWTMRNNPDLNNPSASLAMNLRSPFLQKDPQNGTFIRKAENSPDPRTIKSHLSISLHMPNMLDTCKVVYVARNPKDVCASYYHHCRIMKSRGYVGDFDQFVEYFVNDQLLFSPYGTHINEAWQMRHHKNMHFVFYEDMKANPREAIVDLNNFLGTNLSDEQIDNVLEYTTFKSMKSRYNITMAGRIPYMKMKIVEKDGGFFRKGVVGGFKEKMNPEQEKKIEDWAKKTMGDVPFKF